MRRGRHGPIAPRGSAVWAWRLPCLGLARALGGSAAASRIAGFLRQRARAHHRTLLAIGVVLACSASAAPGSAANAPAPARPALPVAPLGTFLQATLPPCDSDGRPLPAPAILELPDTLGARRALLLRGKCALMRGEFAPAEAIFRQGLAEDKALPRLWSVYLFAALKAQGKDIEALATLAETLHGATRAYVKQRIRQALEGPYLSPPADSTSAGMGPPTPISADDVEYDYLATYVANARIGADDYDLLERLLILAGQRRDDGLLRRLPVLLWRYPKEEAAAQLGMAVPGASPAAVRASLKAEDYTERARRLNELRLPRLLALELGNPTLPILDAEPARTLGRLYLAALLQLKSYRAAANVLEQGLAQRRFGFDPKETATWEVRVALRRRNLQQVLSYLNRLQSLGPDTDTLVGFYLELARQYEQGGDVEHMTEWARRVVALSPGSNGAGTAYWMLVWSRYERDDMAGARHWAEEALSAAPPVPWDFRARLLYWKGRIAAATGDVEGGRQAWAELVARWPSTYYGLVAQSSGEPIPARYAPVRTQPDLAGDAPKLVAVWRHPTLAAALFAYASGEDALAESLLQEALALPLPKDMVREMAALLLVLNEHHLQLRLLANQGPYDLAQVPVGPSPAWRAAFPPAYWDIVEAEAGAAKISPHFILAIMREESRFKIQADSRTGAKGLMQVMPSTALELARRRRIGLTDATLLLPEFNIPIGAQYLRNVLQRFDWSPIFAAAAYNAGPGAVMRWAKAWGVIPFDEFVERIPFDETRSYVRRVYASYLIYRQLYP